MTILDTLLVVMVDEPGRERDALRAMITSMQNVRIVELLENCSSLQNWLVNKYPDVVVIRARSVDEGCLDHFKMIKMSNPHSHFLVIAETAEQVQILRAAGIDQLFLKGFSSNDLFSVFDQWSMEKIMLYFSDDKDQLYQNWRAPFFDLVV